MGTSLYICYFGVREPLVQTQVIPYLRELGKGGHKLSLLTFESSGGDDGRDARVRSELAEQGIAWHQLRYHKRFSVLATAYDILRGALFVRRFVNSERPDILHGRVHVPTLMGALGRKLSRHEAKLLFDIRGFFPEEYTDAGIWPERGILYRVAKSVERWLLKEADGFVVLTENARRILFPESAQTGADRYGRPVEVIPCCVDLSRFGAANAQSRLQVRTELGIDGRFVMAYVGAFGGWYPTEETANLFGTLKMQRPNAFALVLTQTSPSMIEGLLRERGYGDGDLLVTKVDPSEVPRYLSAADAAVSFIKPCYSKQASSPTKNAEYLACGLPVVANDGVGDTSAQITTDNTGVIVREFDPECYAEAIDKLELLLSEGQRLTSRCRESAERRFDLERVGGERYRRLYARLLNQ